MRGREDDDDDSLFYYVCTTILTMTLIIMFFLTVHFISLIFWAFPFIISYFCYVYMIFLVYNCINRSDPVAYCYHLSFRYVSFYSSPKWCYSFIFRTSKAEDNDSMTFHISWLSHWSISHLILARHSGALLIVRYLFVHSILSVTVLSQRYCTYKDLIICLQRTT